MKEIFHGKEAPCPTVLEVARMLLEADSSIGSIEIKTTEGATVRITVSVDRIQREDGEIMLDLTPPTRQGGSQ